jgi:very-short-patch-repair endonuclease
VTSIARTLADLAGVVDARQLQRATREAQYLGLLDIAEVEVVPRRHGAPALRAITQSDEVTRSVFEDAFLRWLRQRKLPLPETNVALSFGEADCIWRDRRVNVELDGNAAHGTRDAFERDRKRDRAAALAGWTVVRVTWRQFRGDPHGLETDLRCLLAVSSRT